jgi:hypothetical protein
VSFPSLGNKFGIDLEIDILLFESNEISLITQSCFDKNCAIET